MLNADDLKINLNIKKLLDVEAKNILGIIDDEIKKAHSLGKHETTVSIPNILRISHLTNTEAQREIYYRIIISLLDRKFKPQLTIDEKNTYVNVKWMTETELADVKKQMDLIISVTKKAAK